ncbi:TonB-dependent receptor [Flavobacterium kingsejongi]|uniref:Collagen-binding protein n=1 Tax=Flavobacterium kingsejongi TaxID=1678728 RepID=A0A2S1LTM0_9FLAO|nr:TonB-dependent receptor [Flavobacterium kingsejongi]AWG27001.1 collagen-binding protein [Flavobacterium kingsejongi]
MNLKNIFWLSLLIMGIFSFTARAQEKYTLSGTVTDGKTSETLIGVTVYILELQKVTVTNQYGFFSISLPKGEYTVQLDYMGFQLQQEKVALNTDIRKNFGMAENSEQLEEVVISEKKNRVAIRKPEMSVNKLSIKDIKKMPAVMGEVDVLKSILQLPGVTNGGEGASGFNVRGGAADQNLILLDEATIYNASHLFGFFSVFNSDAIKDLKLYKGGIPARFGGRVSSVLDIYQKEGNNKDFHMTGGIGAISSRIMVEGPIVKDKASFLIAGRSSYAHLFLKLADMKNSAYFYDLNTKLSYKANENNTLFLSGYFGRDVFDFDKSFNMTYGNTLLNLRWNHLFSDKLFSNLSMIYTDYYYGLSLGMVGLDWDSGIKNYNIKYDLKHYLTDKFTLSYGVNGIYYNFNPGTIRPTNESSGINPRQLDRKYAFEQAVYVEAEQQLSDNIAVNYGLRYSRFNRLGEQKVNTYANDQAVVFNTELQLYEKGTPTGSQSYGKNKSIADFGNLEPRASIAYTLNDNESVKASYNRMAQYIHLISNTASATPLDVWAPSDNFIKPQLLDQYALGYFRNFKDDAYSLEVEGFYKKIKNRIDYIDGADLIANDAIEQVILNGEARAYGLEVLLRKNTGKLNGWISYTLSRAEQRTPGRTPEETGINNGEWYRSTYDKMHNLAVTSSYKYTEKWSFGAILAVQSGRPVTYPEGQYQYQGINVPVYGERNKNNLAAYHHLDISATYTPKPEKTKGWQSEWVFSIYNLYNRRNAASVTFTQNETSGINEAVRLSIFGLIPSVTYNFKF